MYLIQILLPVYDNEGIQFAVARYVETRDELVERFGGLTTYTQAPASGLWQENQERTVRDDLVIYEVMAGKIDSDWWAQYRAALEARFSQEKIVVRAHAIRML